MKLTERTPSPNPMLEDLNFRISGFMNTFSVVLLVAMAMAVGGLGMKIFAVQGGTYVFVFAIIILVLLFLVQIGLSFFYIVSRVKLALLGAFGSLALALSFMALLFRYQGWLGWQLMYFISLPIFLITAFFLGRYLSGNDKLHHNQSRFLYRNLLFPYVLAFVMAAASFILNLNEMPPKPPAAPEAETGQAW